MGPKNHDSGKPTLRRCFSLVLRLYPSAFREDFGPDFLSSVGMQAENIRKGKGKGAEVRYLLATLMALVWEVPGAWRDELRARSSASGKGGPTRGGVTQDVQFAIRVLTRHPGFAAAAILTLTLGVGAVTAVFSVLSPTLLKPLDYPDSHRIVRVSELGPRGNELLVTTLNFQDWRNLVRSFSGLAVHQTASYPGPRTVLGGRTAVRMRVTGVSEDFFQVMGVRPILGRTFTPAEHAGAGSPVAMVGYRYWEDQLGGERDLRQLAITVDDAGVTSGASVTYSVVGVMPPGFDYPDGSRAWVPWHPYSPGRSNHNWIAVARLAPGVTIQTAREELSQVTRQMKEAHGREMHAVDAAVSPLQDELVGDLERPLFLLLGGAALVLIISCVNIASVLLARGAGRAPEFALRRALGANRRRLIRQLLSESLVVAMLGTGSGLLLGSMGARALLRAGPHEMRLAETAVNGQILVFTLVVAVLATLLFGLIPALASSREGGGGPGSGLRATVRWNRGGGPWGWVVGLEVALAVTLAVGGSLFLGSLHRILSVDTGVRVEGLVSAELALPRAAFPDDPAIARYYRELEDELGQLPGIELVGVINRPPLVGHRMAAGFDIEGREETGPGSQYRVVSATYFQTMGMSMVRGREFGPLDRMDERHAVVVNETLARQVWGDDDPLGQRIGNFGNDSWAYGDTWATVVGVVADSREVRLTEPPPPVVYLPVDQRPARARDATVFLKAAGDPASHLGRIRETIESFNSDVAAEVQLFEQELDRSLARERFLGLVSSVFAFLALALACVGVFGVVSYAVAQRTFEIGVRVALGADRWTIVRTITGSTLRAIAIGAGTGAAAALLLGRILEGLLFDLAPSDPRALLFSAGAVALFGTLAALAPALRGVGLDPLRAMREQG